MSYSFGKSIVTDGLVFYVDAANENSYPGTGTTWSDLVGGNDGTTTNSPTYSSSNGGYFEFDGTNQDVDLGNGDDFNVNTTITIDAWVNWSGNNAFDFTPVIDRQTSGSNTWFFGFNGSSRLHFGSNGGNIQSTNTTWTEGVWYHVAGTYNSTGLTGKLYIDGVSDTLSVDNYDAMGATSGRNVRIAGSNSQSRFFNGKIASVKFYNRVLSDAEVLQNYNALKSRFV
jgi:hypothetical protein